MVRETRVAKPSNANPAQSVLVFSGPARGAGPRPVALADMGQASLGPVEEGLEESGKGSLDAEEESGKIRDEEAVPTVCIMP